MADKVGIKTIDFERAALLLSVLTNGAASGAMFSSLTSEAQTELLEMNKVATENVQARAKQAQENQSYAQPKALDTPLEARPAEGGARPYEAGAKPAEPGPKDEGKRK